MTRSHPRASRVTAWRPVVGLALVLMMVAGACGSNDDASQAGSDDAPSDSTAEPSEDELDLDATLDVTWKGDPTVLDPHLQPNTGPEPYWTPVYDTLFDVRDGKVEPRIATEATQSDDGLSWTLTLRDDVTFHDGTPVDAAAAKASIDRARTLEGSTSAGDLALITEVAVDGPTELVITSSEPMPHLIGLLTGAAGALLNPTAIDAGNDFTSKPDGSGPYVVTNFVPSQRVEYKRADDNWDETAGKLAAFTMHFVQDFQAALSGLQTGEYDGAWIDGFGNQIDQIISSSDDLQLVDFTQPPFMLYLAASRPPLDDIRVRQAFARAIDREKIAQGIYNGGADCSAADQLYTEESYPLHVSDLEAYYYDPEEARDLLADAGAAGTPITLTESGSLNQRNTLLAVQPMLEEVGFDVTVNAGNTDAVSQFREQQVDVWMASHNSHPAPLVTVGRYYLPGGAYHTAGYNGDDAELQKLVAQISEPGATEDQLSAGYTAMGEELNRLHVIVPICTPVNHFPARDDIVGLAQRVTGVDMRFVGVRK